MKRFVKEEKGITLIALIITIIVMLILVAVTINVALNGGLFDKAKTASDQTQRESDREQLISAVIATLDKDGKVVFTGEDGLDSNLPDEFKMVSSGIYENKKTGKKYKVDSQTGKVEEYTYTVVDDLIPNAAQREDADESEAGLYVYNGNPTIVYLEAGGIKWVKLQDASDTYMWYCDETTATVIGSNANIELNANQWYHFTDAQNPPDLYTDNYPAFLDSLLDTSGNANGYISRIKASF